MDDARQGVGLVVDEVIDVFGALPSQRRAVPEVSGAKARGVEMVYAHDRFMVFVLDVDAVTAVTQDLDLSEVAL